jgi:hypothetical protein
MEYDNNHFIIASRAYSLHDEGAGTVLGDAEVEHDHSALADGAVFVKYPRDPIFARRQVYHESAPWHLTRKLG